MFTRPSAGWAPLIRKEISMLSQRLGVELPADVAALEKYLDLVTDWSRTHDLTAARTAEELVDLYLADALVLRAVAAAGTWIDVGTGGGAPGLTAAMLFGRQVFTLVEPRAKRVAFLRTVVGTLDLGKFVRVKKARGEEIESGAADFAVSRATFSPELWLPIGARIARKAVWVLLARGAVPAHPACELEASVTYEWPLTGVEHRALRFGVHARKSSRESST